MRKLCFLLFLVLTVHLAACSTKTVGHLHRRPWLVNTPQTLEMKFWRFEYRSQPLADGVGIRGMAYPNPDKFPEWAQWYDKLEFTAYLSDASGRVLADKTITALPRSLAENRAVPFEFRLEPSGTEGPLYLAFGYRMLLTEEEWKPGTKTQGRVHMAHEGALEQ